ncbi:MAG: hypothetical protein IKA62_00930 [Clostridia bacterium]|nr:hypothetical protein [Clostridia bacterium]
MKRILDALISGSMIFVMLLAALVACNVRHVEQTTATTDTYTTERPTIPSEESSEELSEESSEESSEAIIEVPEWPSEIESPYMDTIIYANSVANTIQQNYAGVTQWFSNNGQTCNIQNLCVDMTFLRDNATKDQYVGYINNKDGATYIENTMDVYVRMSDGNTYYTSKTTNDCYTNVYRHGYYYHEIRMERLNFANDAGERVETLQVARIFHTYPDKLHHEIQVCSSKVATTGIDAIGFITEIAADRVAKIQIRDKKGIHSTLDDIDWASVEYVGFDIVDAGIFGYILPVCESAGTITVTLEDGKYIIVQETAPNGGIIEPGNENSLNENDFYSGQRIYTDTTHDFENLDKEAYIERNPLGAKSIKLSTAYSDSAAFSGYDSLRGSYIIDMSYTVSSLWDKRQNLHFEANFGIKGDDVDRVVYMVVAHNGGVLECAVVLDDNMMSLPIPIQVGKNFSNDGDDKNQNVTGDSNVTSHNIFNYADKQYSEAIFPMVVKAGDMKEYSVLHLYQNWGNYPLKQISFIHFYVPYYHFSTGMTETNCICYNATNVDMLPDHRAMSAPYWAEGVQHTSGGWHGFFTYQYSPKTSKTGLRNVDRYVVAHGPTYAEVDMTFESTDGNIKATYTHMEMPQMDENRAYYTMTYEFLEDTGFKGFKDLVKLYYVSSRNDGGQYVNLGYLNENNECVVEKVSLAQNEPIYRKLGDEYPYFDMFELETWSGGMMGYVNVAFLIKDYEVIMEGEKADVDLLIREENKRVALTLDLENVKFKKGDSITIHAILVPWGSQNSDYSGTDYAPDQNVRDIRENTLINPIKIEAGENTTVIEDPFMPKVRTENGKDAEFTVSGYKVSEYKIPDRDEGYYITVRAYGFTKLTAPKVYQFIDGEWVEYELSSRNTPDTLGYTNQHDGYAVHYEGDGTVSYSFVIDMSDAKSKRFRIDTDHEFNGFARVETEELVLHPYNVIFEPSQIASIAKKNPMFTKHEQGQDGGMLYMSLHGVDRASTSESWLSINQNDLNGAVTGQYVIMKYRLPADNPDTISFLEIFAGTEHTGAQGPDSFKINKGIESDGRWHLIVLDTQAAGYAGGPGKYVKADTDTGEYLIKYMRIDLFNRNVNPQTHWDIAFVAAHDDLATILEANSDLEYVTLITGNDSFCLIDPKTGEEIK